jgi:sigma-B regulation protein RsbU (phosphoserine phosphatase)
MTGKAWEEWRRHIGWAEYALFVSLLIGVAGRSGLGGTLEFFGFSLAILFALISAVRWAYRATKRAIWHLRNRLIVAYLFIAFVPLLLMLVLLELGAWALTGQIGAYLLNSEFERRVDLLRRQAEVLSKVPQQMRSVVISRVGSVLRERFHGAEIAGHGVDGALVHFPDDSTLPMPPPGHPDGAGLLEKDGVFHLWAHVAGERFEVAVVVPITRSFLTGLVREIGDVVLLHVPPPGQPQPQRSIRLHRPVPGEPPAESGGVPPRRNILDLPVFNAVTLPLAIWDKPNSSDESATLGVRSRISRILSLLVTLRTEREQPLIFNLFIGAAIVFLLVQIVSIKIGLNLTRTITLAVNELYDGTERVKVGDLSHRIEVRGNDQLAELTRSFNGMTENLERLLSSEKERQRLQAELEIAREVQSQLHPKPLAGLGSLRLTSVCNAARMVSGDYFDYQKMGDTRLAIAIGDVAGKGISAALLMASLQSAMRSQLRHCMEMAAAATAGGGSEAAPDRISTSKLISNLNQQLYASTAPEKYATFFFGVYDENSHLLTYTNAGHLPPMLIRGGTVTTLDTNGMVVGAFPFARYGESQLRLHAGDLLLCYTDGITEPENEYGEQFGEERLSALLLENAHREGHEIAGEIVDAVSRWTASPELQDDMTMLLARKL